MSTNRTKTDTPCVTGAGIKLPSGQTVTFSCGNAREFYRAARLTGRIGRYCNRAIKSSKKLEDQLGKISELYSQLFKEETTS